MRSIFHRILYVALGIVIAGGGAVVSFTKGYEIGQATPEVVTVRGVLHMEPEGPAPVDFATFWKTWTIIEEKYIDNEEVVPEEKLYGAIRGLVRSLGDPYSEYFDPEDNQKFREDLEGSFGGIGAEIGIRNDQLIVISPLKNSPAERAGVLAGDAILSIDEGPTFDLSVSEAVSRIRGDVGTEVMLTIFRDGWEKPKDMSITREVITIPTVELGIRENTAHVELFSFNMESNELIGKKLQEAFYNDIEGIVLDLRNNPGGFLDVAVQIAGWFLPPDTLVVSERGRDGVVTGRMTRGNGLLADFPMVVLINEGSASASEILAGALRDQRKVKLVGAKSFGKGSVQELDALPDGSSVKVTTARWLLPSGTEIEGGGLIPDVEVIFDPETVEVGKDPQLEKAIEVLQEEIKKSPFAFEVELQ